jgi:hypothetical protein
MIKNIFYLDKNIGNLTSIRINIIIFRKLQIKVQLGYCTWNKEKQQY